MGASAGLQTVDVANAGLTADSNDICEQGASAARHTGGDRRDPLDAGRPRDRADRGPAGVPPRPGRVAAARLARTQGFAYDYYAETQLDDGTLDLRSIACWSSRVHPEYWTRRMYERVKRWVFEEGGRLVYLGGNGLNCEVELRADGSMSATTASSRG